MKKQTLITAVKISGGVIQQIGRGSVPHPPVKFKGGEVKWYEDKLKQRKD